MNRWWIGGTSAPKSLSMKRIYKAIAVRVGLLLFAIRKALPGTSLRSAYGPRLVKRKGDLTYGFCVLGTYGDLLSGLLGEMREPFVFLDIGANMGLYSYVAARNPACTQVFAFEPVPAVYADLVRNKAANEAAQVIPICGAIASAEPLLRLAFDPHHSGKSRISDEGGIVALTIGARHLDAMLPGNARMVAKIDVEGAENDVIAVLRQTAAYSRVTDIVIEISRRNLSAEQIEALKAMLTADGYRERRRTGGESHYDAHYSLATG
jgi:FkbM family methyltransferase